MNEWRELSYDGISDADYKRFLSLTDGNHTAAAVLCGLNQLATVQHVALWRLPELLVHELCVLKPFEGIKNALDDIATSISERKRD
jgi:hypothetical protein